MAIKLNGKPKLVVWIIAVAIFGLLSGIVGELVARTYLLEQAFNVPFFGELNFLDYTAGGPSLIIRDPKKVVVETDTKVENIALNTRAGIMGIYKKSVSAPAESKINQKSSTTPNFFYNLNSALGQAFILTSDGWVMTSFLPAEIKAALARNIDIKKAVSDALANYILLSYDRQFYAPDQIIIDQQTSFAFWHVKAQDLAVNNFAAATAVKPGISLLGVNWHQMIWPVNLIGVQNTYELVRSSDNCSSFMILSSAPSSAFYGAFLFDFNSALVGLIDNEGKAWPLSNLQAVINSLLKTKTIVRPKLGVNYIHLPTVYSSTLPAQGALIAKDKNNIAIIKGSPADKAEFKIDDIILTVNNTIVDANNDLCTLLAGKLPSEEVSIVLQRGSDKIEKKVILGK